MKRYEIKTACTLLKKGGQLLSGASEIELFGKECRVYAEIGQLTGLSAQADSNELCQFIACQDAEKVKQVFLVHGEYHVQQELAARLERKGFKQITIPAQHHEIACAI